MSANVGMVAPVPGHLRSRASRSSSKSRPTPLRRSSSSARARAPRRRQVHGRQRTGQVARSVRRGAAATGRLAVWSIHDDQATRRPTHARRARGVGLEVDAGQGGDPPQRRRQDRRRRAAVRRVSGYEHTVMPQLENALLAGHDVIFLGERGQAKTRIIRSLTGLLDEWMPIVAGSEINDDPYAPVSKHARDLIAEHGDDDADRLGAPRRPLRREAGHARHVDRRPDRRGRPDQGRRGPLPQRRADAALRPRAAHQPRHLRDQRDPRPRRAHPGRPAQRARGARRAGPRLQDPPAARRACSSPAPTPRTTPTAAASSRR